jgi:hypothetical protein
MRNFKEPVFNAAVTVECSSGGFPILEDLSLRDGGYLKDVFRCMPTTEEGIGSGEVTEQQTRKVPALCPELMKLNLCSLRKLKNIISCCNSQQGNITYSPLPPGSFQNLQDVRIDECLSLRYLFSWSHVPCLVQLRTLKIVRCDSLEEIVDGGDRNAGQPLHTIFPKLKRLILSELPELVGICSNDDLQQPLNWSSELEHLKIRNCPSLTRSFLSGQSAAKLKDFKVDEDWFESLEWEDENVKKKWKDKARTLYPLKCYFV